MVYKPLFYISIQMCNSVCYCRNINNYCQLTVTYSNNFVLPRKWTIKFTLTISRKSCITSQYHVTSLSSELGYVNILYFKQLSSADLNTSEIFSEPLKTKDKRYTTHTIFDKGRGVMNLTTMYQFHWNPNVGRSYETLENFYVAQTHLSVWYISWLCLSFWTYMRQHFHIRML